MRIDKVKWDGSKVRVEYSQERPDGSFDEFSLSSLDAPAQFFKDALDALRQDVAGICELPAGDAEKLTIRGVTFTHTNDVFGACITALKRLKTANAPLVLNTPHLTEEPYGEGDTTTPVLSAETDARLRLMALAAEQYVNGDREQQGLFQAETVAAQ